ncbi:S-adenosyl methyltransferase [Stackebrandtia endophytica]|uniref:S-adenosyl methyltransferase n=1 Tax=Stackebrandtia endophytica TaxID=1496996 RepID=A0A543B3V4_9ACTN|nr:SAM-dependent methyltransferase [Stackebrandtia endophytica]TQL79473.1 S-adenosyl methyltransferase [Stackebrandtia endophytica]
MNGERRGSTWTIDTSKASVARVYDAALGGKDNYEVDRQMLEKLLVHTPDMFDSPRMVKEFGKRVTQGMTRLGIRQILDLGSGIPTTPPSVHDTARAIAPDTRVIYVDNDPVVVSHSRALRDVAPGLVSILADINDVDRIFAHPDVAANLDLGQPVGILLISVLQNTLDDQDAKAIVRSFADRVVPGSYLGLAHVSTRSAPASIDGVRRNAEQAGYPEVLFRDDDSVRSLFEGFELLAPGVVDIKDWRPDDPGVRPVNIKLVGGLGVKPG